MLTRDEANGFRYDGSARGHYESYFQRANHPTRPLAFWIRYTLFAPQGHPERAVGELWAVYFDGETGRIAAAKESVPLAACSFAKAGLAVRIGGATLDSTGLDGSARTRGHALTWSLRYASPEPPLLLLPEGFYRGGFPKAKALVGSPLAMFDGHLEVNGSRVEVSAWTGSQNHNWGSKHTDRYAWGQVAGFDDAPSAFFECATASIKLGPLYSPRMSPMVLRLDGEEHRLNPLVTALRATARYGYFHWSLSSRNRHVSVRAEFHAPLQHFVGLRYGNPPGGEKTCLNTKLAACRVSVARPGRPIVVLTTAHRAAFEILTDDAHHGVAMLDA